MESPISCIGSNDPDHPHNWPLHRRWTATVLVSTFTFTTLMTSTMVAPALPELAKDLHIGSEAAAQLVLSAYVIGYAFGPFLWGPSSELYGRRIILQCGSTWFFIWNLVCGFSKSKVSMIAGRVLSSIGASAALAISSGVLSDCWTPAQRGRSLSIYTLMPLLAPAIGPIVSAYITQYSTWRWSFWSTSAFDAFIQVLAICLLEETHAPTILRGKVSKSQKPTELSSPELTRQPTTLNRQVVLSRLLSNLRNPFHLLFTQLPIQLLALLNGISFGILYIVLSSIPRIFTSQYHQSKSKACLHYLALGLGFIVGAQAFASLTDTIYRRYHPAQESQIDNNTTTLRSAANSDPKIRTIPLFPATFLSSLGLICLGWSARSRVHWLVPDLGILIFGAGNQVATQCVNAYIVDAFGPTDRAASAMSGVWAAKSAAGFGFPLFAPVIYRGLGYGWANTVLAVGSVAVAGPISLLLWVWSIRRL